jgi:hypothetical protein
MSESKTTASEGTGALEIGPLREDEQFGDFVYRHENVHGISYPPGLNEAKMDLFKDNFQGRPDDVYIVTFPKSGTTWTQQVLHLLHNRGEQGDVPLIRAIPWVERVVAAGGEQGLQDIESMPSPRFFKSHTPVHLFPRVDNAKYIIVGRNPKDTMVSMFHHARSKVEFEYEGDWASWYRIFLDGFCESGDWFEFTLGWYKESLVNPNVLFFTYEDMKMDPAATVRSIASFVNFPDVTDELIQTVVEKSSFKSMKSNELTNCTQIPQRGEPHMRKGQVGDWKNYFTVAQSEAFDEVYEELMGDSGLRFTYEQSEQSEEEKQA